MNTLGRGTDDGWFEAEILQKLDGILLGTELGITDWFAFLYGDGTMIGTLDGVENGVMLGTDDDSFGGIALGRIDGIMLGVRLGE